MRLAVSSSHLLALLRVRSRREFGLVMKGGVLTSGIGFYPPSLSPLQQPTRLAHSDTSVEYTAHLQGMSPAIDVPDLRRTPHTAAADTLAAL